MDFRGKKEHVEYGAVNEWYVKELCTFSMYEQDPAEVEDLSDGAGMSSEDTERSVSTSLSRTLNIGESC